MFGSEDCMLFVIYHIEMALTSLLKSVSYAICKNWSNNDDLNAVPNGTKDVTPSWWKKNNIERDRMYVNSVKWLNLLARKKSSWKCEKVTN